MKYRNTKHWLIVMMENMLLKYKYDNKQKKKILFQIKKMKGLDNASNK